MAIFLIGWLFPGLPEEPLGVSRGAGDSARLLVLRPGESTGQAVRFLRTLQRDPPPPAPPVVVVRKPPPPPPPPDFAVTFKAALAGIVRDAQSGRLSVLLRDGAAGRPQMASKTVGDEVGDGWRIQLITADSVTLRRGRENRVVRLYG